MLCYGAQIKSKKQKPEGLMDKTIGVIGAGAWGTALAQALSKGGRDVTIWSYEPETTDSINATHENAKYLPGIALDKKLQATSILNEVVLCDILLMVTPAQHMADTLERIKDNLRDDQYVVLCSKGIELDTGRLLSEVAEEIIPHTKLAILSGPTFAKEIAAGLPAAATLATKSEKDAELLQDALGVEKFRPYITNDIIGTQLCGAIKNVIAIACGVIIGQGLGESARAALLARGMAEIARLGVAMGAKRETLMGMCGIGDLTLTCTSMKSRNYSLGVALGEGNDINDILKTRHSVTEGVHTAQSALALAKSYAVDMPITQAVNDILLGKVTRDQGVTDMLNKPFKYRLSKYKEKPLLR
jgi:glycerol-3-phosphate dehydrogenase (NAD(P)+)